jgi:hypothetical protein
MNMMAAPLSKNYGVEITRTIGVDMVMFVYRNKCYSAFHKNQRLDKKSIRIETGRVGD